MRTNVLILVCLLSSFGLLIGQNGNFWQETSESLVTSKQNPLTFKNSDDIKYFKLDFNEMKSTLKNAPKEFDRSSKLIVSFPMADGSIERFSVNETSVMAPALAAKYPNIKTYSGVGIDNPHSNIRFEHTPRGFFGSIHTPTSKIFIDPTEVGNMEYVMVFDRENISKEDGEELTRFSCGSDMDFLLEPEMADQIKNVDISTAANRSSNTQVLLRVHRLALACTGEFGRGFGGTLESVNSTYATILNRVNQIFQTEVAVKLELIADNDNLIFLDPDTDPYESSNCGSCLLGQNLPTFLTQGISTNSYDIGHVFTGGCTDVGGVVSGGMCTDNGKMRGVTCVRSINGAVDIMAHEVGHQYSCGHSWDNCPATAEQRSGANALEPGSGSTIMSYAGTCGDQNVINGRGDEYYNIGSLKSFIRYVKEVQPNCGVDVFNGNNAPVVNIELEDGFYIPARTPFELTAVASDEDGDAITYCWEQTDIEITASSIGSPTGNAPIMRSRPPTASPTRLFPTRANILANIGSTTELLPTYSRDLSFACTVRDNVADGGGTVWDEVSFKVDGESGPFRLEFPSGLTDELKAGENVEFTWDPANSQNAPVNCKAVNLLISYDDGATFIDTLAKDVINDGSFFVNIPDSISNIARIKVEAADNIFFDYSNSRIRIAEAAAPGYTVSIPEFREVCAPANISFDVATGSVLEFDNPVELSIVGELPSVISEANFVNNNLVPGEASALELEIAQPETDMTVELMVQAVSLDADTIFRAIQVNIFSTDFSALTLDGPADGLAGVVGAPQFDWSENTSASSYDFQLATSPDFNEESIFTNAENLTETNFSLDRVLEATTVYYWRVIPSGICGPGEPTVPAAFSTESTDCQDIAAVDLPINISTSFSGDISSKINVTQTGIISDINVINITGNHSDFSDLSFSLKSPAGTTVRLVSNKCFAQNTTYDMSFDQESPFDFSCPPRNAFIPQESLDAFNGEPTEGLWELIINDRSAQFGGTLRTWSLEFCSSIASDPPVLVRNDNLLISEDFEKVINNGLLRVEDANNFDFEIKYTLVTVPEFGDLLMNGTPLAVGEQFTQFDLNNNLVSFRSDQIVEVESDDFLFTVIDGDGGFTGTHNYTVEFVERGVSTSDLTSVEVEVFPNPVKDLLFVKTNNNFALDGDMEVYNLQGQLMIQQGIRGSVRESINTAPLGTGIYFLRIQDGENYSITKFVVKK